MCEKRTKTKKRRGTVGPGSLYAYLLRERGDLRLDLVVKLKSGKQEGYNKIHEQNYTRRRFQREGGRGGQGKPER